MAKIDCITSRDQAKSIVEEVNCATEESCLNTNYEARPKCIRPI